MTANDIITLANAGFNATQIVKILEIANAPAQVPAQVPVPPAQVPTQVPVPPAQVPTQVSVPPAQVPTQVPVPPAQVPVPPAQVPTQVPVPPAKVPTNAPDYILQAIQKVYDRLNQLAIQNSQMPERQTTDDILAEIINPPRGEEKK